MRYITPYNPDWPRRFAHIVAYLVPLLPKDCRIHHIGSTSVPGMPAKDVIDLVIECPGGSIRAVIDALSKAGYEHQGDRGIPGREVFRPASESEPASFPSHHLYTCESGAAELRKELAFRDYLIRHPHRAHWLAQQKIAADASAPTRAAYIDNKSPSYALITSESLHRLDPAPRTGASCVWRAIADRRASCFLLSQASGLRSPALRAR